MLSCRSKNLIHVDSSVQVLTYVMIMIFFEFVTTVCLDRGPISEEETQCLQCADNSRGKLCQECSPGYFEMNKTCVACMCNGHGDSNSCEAGGYFSTAHMHAFTGCFYV